MNHPVVTITCECGRVINPDEDIIKDIKDDGVIVRCKRCGMEITNANIDKEEK